MRVRNLIWVVIGMGLGLSAGRVEAVETALPEGAVVWDDGLLSEEKASRRAGLAETAWSALQQDAGAAAALLESEPSVLIREWAAAELLQRLQDGPSQAAADGFLSWAERQPVQVFVQHEETRAAAFLPLFDIAQRARDVRRLWAEGEARARWAGLWASEPAGALGAASAAGPAELAAASEALLELSAEAWPAVRRSMEASPPASLPTALWLVAARRAADPLALREVFARGTPEQRLRALPLLDGLETTQAVERLVELESDAELASAATLALVPRLLEANDQPALRARLADPARRHSTAAGLAREAALGKRLAAIDALQGALQNEAERAGWLRLLALLDSQAQRKRWALDAEAQP